MQWEIVDYYDVYHPSGPDISPVTTKAMRFAYQRELRFVLDPGRVVALAEGAYFMDIGSIADIAGIYGGDGRRIAGTAPDFLPRVNIAPAVPVVVGWSHDEQNR